jgi:hypothetical protein
MWDNTLYSTDKIYTLKIISALNDNKLYYRSSRILNYYLYYAFISSSISLLLYNTITKLIGIIYTSTSYAY